MTESKLLFSFFSVFFFVFTALHNLWDLSSTTRDQGLTLGHSGSQNPNQFAMGHSSSSFFYSSSFRKV